MTIFDLLFLILFLVLLGSAIVAAVAALRRQGPRALRIVRRIGIVSAAYLGVVCVVSAFSPQRFVRVGDDQCSDDWCVAVQDVRRDTAGADVRYVVTLRLSNRARRATQRERFVAVYLRDEEGRRYDPLPDAAAVPFDTLLSPSQVIPATRRFIVPAQARVAGVVITREGGGRFPRCCIVGDDASFFHRRTMVEIN